MKLCKLSEMKKYQIWYVKSSILLILLSSHLLFAQENSWRNEIPKVISPQAYEFTKYGDVPVSKYTGVPDITVPIYNLQAAGFNIPIALSYHSNGVKVAEEASWVGFGWSLIGGGSIVQVVNQYDDYGSYGSSIPPFEHPSYFNIPGGVSDCQSKIINYLDGGFNGGDDGIDPDVIGGIRGSESDIFNFNFFGYSGSFIHDGANNQFVPLDNKNLRIQSDMELEGSLYPQLFHITVPEGHTFHFALMSTTRYDYINNSLAPNPNPSENPIELQGQAASRLYEIILIETNKGEKIYFEYEQSAELKNYPSVSQTSTWHTFTEFTDPGPNALIYFPQAQTATAITITSQKYNYLKSIRSDKVLIEFVSTLEREDLVGARRLTSIVVKNNTNNNDVVKTFDFTYSYFIGHTSGTTIDSYLPDPNVIAKSLDERKKRLKLLSVKENGLPPYQFSYIDYLGIPLKTSLAYDQWGFYNSNLSSTLSTRSSSDEISLMACLLRKIIYPTNGSSFFTYERNEIDDPDINPQFETTSGSIKLFDDNDRNPYTNVSNNFVYITSPRSGWLLVPEGGATIKLYKSLNVNGTCSDNPSNLTYYPNVSWNIESYSAAAKDLVELNGWSSIPTVVSNPAYRTNVEVGRINVGENKFKVWDWGTSKLAPGLYFYSVGVNDACGPQNTVGQEAHAFLSLEYEITKRIVTPTGYGGGLRIKSISTIDEGANVLVKQFKYFEPKLMSKPVYEYNSPFHLEYLFIPPYQCNGCCNTYTAQGVAHKISSNSYFAPSTNAAGKYVGYSRVEEYNVDPNNSSLNNGYVSTTYQNQPDRVEVDNVNLPTIKNNRANGLALVDSVYSSNNILMQTTKYTYTDDQLDCFWGLKVFWRGTYIIFIDPSESDAPCLIETQRHYDAGFYPIKRVETLMKSKKNTVFDNGQIINSITEFEYDSHNQLKKEKLTNSEGKLVEVLFSYPYDQSSEAVPAQMVQENFIAPQMLIEKKENGNSVYLEKNDFKIIDNSTLYQPKKYFDKEKISFKYGISEIFNDAVEFQLYDQDKLLQYVALDGLLNTFIWGYNKEYVVAKIVGASYSQAINLVDQNILNNPPSDQALNTELEKIRNGLPGAMVTTYTHKPLVGLSTVTDPNGNIHYYEYDIENRLKLIRDKNGNIITTYKYDFVKE